MLDLLLSIWLGALVSAVVLFGLAVVVQAGAQRLRRRVDPAVPLATVSVLVPVPRQAGTAPERIPA